MTQSEFTKVFIEWFKSKPSLSPSRFAQECGKHQSWFYQVLNHGANIPVKDESVVFDMMRKYGYKNEIKL